MMLTDAERERIAAAAVEAAELAHERAERDALVAASGRSWDAGPPQKPAQVTVPVETEAGMIQAPATIDPATALAMRYEAAGMERKPDGTWGAGFSPVDP